MLLVATKTSDLETMTLTGQFCIFHIVGNEHIYAFKISLLGITHRRILEILMEDITTVTIIPTIIVAGMIVMIIPTGMTVIIANVMMAPPMKSENGAARIGADGRTATTGVVAGRTINVDALDLHVVLRRETEYTRRTGG